MDDTRRAGRGFRALAETVAALTAPALGKRGLSNAALLADWPRIVGETLGRRSLPEKLVFPPRQRRDGVLHVRVASGALALELQHTEPLVVERINGYYGFPAVARLRLRHAPMETFSAPAPIIADEPGGIDESRLAALVAHLPDGELRRTLFALGRSLAPPQPGETDGSGACSEGTRRERACFDSDAQV